MENFSPELIRAQTEALDIQKRAKEAKNEKGEYEALTRDDYEKASQNELPSKLNEIFLKLQNTRERNVERTEVLAEYRMIIESAFQKFIDEYGEGKFDNMKDFLIYWDNFHTFLETNSVPASAMYDFGLRFNIETAINNSVFEEKEKKLIKDYLLKCTPYNYADEQARIEARKELIVNAEDKQQLIDNLGKIKEKSFIMDLVSKGPRGSLLTLNPNAFGKIKRENIDIYEGASDEFISIWKKHRGFYLGVTGHPNLFSSDFLNIRGRIAKASGLDFKQPDEEQEEELNIEKVVKIIKEEFGIDIISILEKTR